MKPTPEEALAAFDWWENAWVDVEPRNLCFLRRQPKGKCPARYRNPEGLWGDRRPGCSNCSRRCWQVIDRNVPYRLLGHGETRLEALLDAMRKEAER